MKDTKMQITHWFEIIQTKMEVLHMNVLITICLSLYVSQITTMEWVTSWKNEEIVIGVVDRIEGETVVILVEEQHQEFHIEKERIPVSAHKDGWFLLLIQDKELIILKKLPSFEVKQKKKSNELLERLRKEKQLFE